LIVLGSGGAQVLSNPNNTCGTGGTSACDGPFDGNDDTLVGIVNQTDVAIPTVALVSTSDIFHFDGDGICSGKYGTTWLGETGCPYTTNPTDYEGPGTSFSGYGSGDGYTHGNVNFSGAGLGAGASTFFSLESALNSATFTIPASFTVAKTATPASVVAGDTATPITYTITATNQGGATGSMTISDMVPTGTTLVSGTVACGAVSGGSCGVISSTPPNLAWSLTGIPAGGTGSVTFQVTANSNAPNPVDNTAMWSGPGCVETVLNVSTTGVSGDDASVVQVPAAAQPASVPTCGTNETMTTVTQPIPVTVTASNISYTYGSTPPAVTATYSPLVTPATPATCSTTNTDASAVGTTDGADTCTGASDPRYTFTPVAGNATVNPATLTVTAASSSVIYGGGTAPHNVGHAIPVSVASITGFVLSQTSSVITTQPTCSTAATAASPVGTYPTVCTGGVAPNYVFAFVNGVLTVSPAALTITASSGSATVGGTIPAITAGYVGFVNGDSASSLTPGPTCSTTATSSSTAAVYPTNCTGANDPNYVISYVPGTMSLTAAPATAPATVTPAAAAPAAAPSTAPAIAFTGAFLDQEWVFGISALLAGIALLLIGRRLRSPKHAARR
jgi:uncharacterized repeat protein (TIGR01451 family)